MCGGVVCDGIYVGTMWVFVTMWCESVVMCGVWQASMSPEERAAALACMSEADRAAALVRI